MKKLTAILISLLIIISCSACNSEDDSKSQADTTELLAQFESDAQEVEKTVKSLRERLESVTGEDDLNDITLNGVLIIGIDEDYSDLAGYATMSDLCKENDLKCEGDFYTRKIGEDTYRLCVGFGEGEDNISIKPICRDDKFNGLVLNKDSSVAVLVDMFGDTSVFRSYLNNVSGIKYFESFMLSENDFSHPQIPGRNKDNERFTMELDCATVGILIDEAANCMSLNLTNVSYDGVPANDRENLTVGHVLKGNNYNADESFFERTLEDGKTYHIVLDKSNHDRLTLTISDEGQAVSPNTLIYDLAVEAGVYDF